MMGRLKPSGSQRGSPELRWLGPAGSGSGGPWVRGSSGEEIEIVDGDEQDRARAGMAWDHAFGREFDFGDADSVFDEEDFFGAAVEDVEASVFVPFRGRGAEFVVLQEFDVDDAEGLVAEIAGDVGVVAGRNPVCPSCSLTVTGSLPWTALETSESPSVT